MLGLGGHRNIPRALEYFENAGNDGHALNALGVIYFEAPEVFETDPVKLQAYGKVRKDLKLARNYFEKAANAGNLNAKYNTGVLWLQEDNSEQFSYNKAYENFKSAAAKGHTLSSYNLGVMNYLGLGSYKSCQLASAFFKHVIAVGEHSQSLKTAYRMV